MAVPPSCHPATRLDLPMGQILQAVLALQRSELVARLQQGLFKDAASAGCALYSTQVNSRLIKLLSDAVTLSILSPPATALAASDILADFVSSNLGYMPVLSAASKGPFRVCGATGAWLLTYVSRCPSPNPPALRGNINGVGGLTRMRYYTLLSSILVCGALQLLYIPVCGANQI